MKEFLEEPVRLQFTQCFRLSNDLAAMLGRVWKKQIKGVNDRCKVEEMTKEEAAAFLAGQEREIFCAWGQEQGRCPIR